MKLILALTFLLGSPWAPVGFSHQEVPAAPAAQGTGGETPFEGATRSIQGQLEKSVASLNELRSQVAAEKIPMTRELSELEAELSRVRLAYQDVTRTLDSRTLDLSNLQGEIKSREEESSYLAGLLTEYVRNFESRLHIAELQRYRTPIQMARLALEDNTLSEREVFQKQIDLVSTSMDRVGDALGGMKFEGTAVDSAGLVNQGVFLLLGPTAIFKSILGSDATLAEQRLGSLEPASIAFGSPEDALAAGELFANPEGFYPLDPSMGNALMMEATHESFLEHVQKGGAVMIPIGAMAGMALLFAIYKWIAMATVGTAKEKRVASLIEAIGERDESAVRRHVEMIRGPVGKMLTRGVDHMREPRELVEEVMYETILKTRLKLQSLLPFIAISAASAPLLGLLGTVTGIINTFKMITVFGSGDVKSLSGGISEALITTKFGLIVAIPSLLLHAFLSRKARRIVDNMEKTALAFTNELSRAHYAELDTVNRQPAPLAEPHLPSLEEQLAKILVEQERVAGIVSELSIVKA